MDRQEAKIIVKQRRQTNWLAEHHKKYKEKLEARKQNNKENA